MKDKHSTSSKKIRITSTVLKDVQRGDFWKTLRRDLKEITEFYIDEEHRVNLNKKRKVFQWLFLSYNILKSLILKLTPTRRILLVLSLIFFSIQSDALVKDQVRLQINFQGLGYLILLIILALELKDKLLARDEIEVGRKVQLALLPEKNPLIPGWDIFMMTRPANDIGGDLVDYLSLNNNRWALCLADVSGKGIGAALLMSKLQATIRAIAPSARSIKQFGEQLNTIFYRDCLNTSFASLLYFEIGKNAGQIRILNAGHLPPFIISGGKLIELPQGSAALGLQSKTSYEEQSVTLQTGDLMFVYSDGLIEAKNEKDEFYGENQLRQLINQFKSSSPRYIAEEILKAVAAFVGDRSYHDDLSMVIAKRTA